MSKDGADAHSWARYMSVLATELPNLWSSAFLTTPSADLDGRPLTGREFSIAAAGLKQPRFDRPHEVTTIACIYRAG